MFMTLVGKWWSFSPSHVTDSHYSFGQQWQRPHLLAAYLWGHYFRRYFPQHRGGPGSGVRSGRTSPAHLCSVQLHRPEQHAPVSDPPVPGHHLHLSETGSRGLRPAHSHCHGKTGSVCGPSTRCVKLLLGQRIYNCSMLIWRSVKHWAFLDVVLVCLCVNTTSAFVFSKINICVLRSLSWVYIHGFTSSTVQALLNFICV